MPSVPEDSEVPADAAAERPMVDASEKLREEAAADLSGAPGAMPQQAPPAAVGGGGRQPFDLDAWERETSGLEEDAPPDALFAGAGAGLPQTTKARRPSAGSPAVQQRLLRPVSHRREPSHTN